MASVTLNSILVKVTDEGCLNAMGPQQRRREILAEIARLGVVLPVSLVEHSTRCQSSGCHCHGDPPRSARALSHLDAPRRRPPGDKDAQCRAGHTPLQPLLAADRRLRQLVKELEALAVSEVDDLLG